MVTLVDLGFSKDAIYETIVCTYNQAGVPNAAPMGVVMQSPEEVGLVIYNSASTLRNLQDSKSATLNLVDDVDVFFYAALKDSALSVDWFEKSDKVDAPQLRLSKAVIAIIPQSFVSLDNLRTKVTSKVTHVMALTVYPQSYCRAKSAVIEAIIHATRIKALSNIEKEQAHVDKLVKLIQNCNEVVNRSAPNSHYTKLMSNLQKKINSWMMMAKA